MAKVNIVTKSATPKPSEVYDTYWKFAAERQEIFFRRFRNEPPPWTNDQILTEHKFTNAYRASDRVSQCLIKDVLYKGDQTPEEVFFRCILFKIFNRESTWNLLERELGEVKYSRYSFKTYDGLLTEAQGRKERIFSAAYIMPTHAAGYGEKAKHQNYLALLDKMMKDGVPSKLSGLK